MLLVDLPNDILEQIIILTELQTIHHEIYFKKFIVKKYSLIKLNTFFYNTFYKYKPIKEEIKYKTDSCIIA